MKAVRAGVQVVAVLALALPTGRRLDAQAPREARWVLEGGEGSYCIWYLADPDLAKQMTANGTTLTPAGTGAGLPPLIARIVQDEPRFAQWIPGSICIGYYQRVSSDGRTLATGKPNRPVIVATSSLMAQSARGVPATGSYLLDLLTDNRGLAAAGDRLGIDLSSISVLSRLKVGADDPEVSIDVSGVQFIWSGRPVGQGSVGKTRSVSFGYAGSHGNNWLIQVESAPGASRLMAGGLQVRGRNSLAKALQASPVRAIGPEESGGTVTMTFQLVTRK